LNNFCGHLQVPTDHILPKTYQLQGKTQEKKLVFVLHAFKILKNTIIMSSFLLSSTSLEKNEKKLIVRTKIKQQRNQVLYT
jgi:hypothetical protein